MKNFVKKSVLVAATLYAVILGLTAKAWIEQGCEIKSVAAAAIMYKSIIAAAAFYGVCITALWYTVYSAYKEQQNK